MARTKSRITGVFDAGPIIHPDELACLDLISDFRENLLPDMVWKEINAYPREIDEVTVYQVKFTK